MTRAEAGPLAAKGLRNLMNAIVGLHDDPASVFLHRMAATAEADLAAALLALLDPTDAIRVFLDAPVGRKS